MSDLCLQNALNLAAKKINSPSARIDAEVLLMYLLKKNRAFLYSYSESTLTQQQYVDYTHLVDLRVAGHPVAYLIGQREFWSMPISVTPDTLIPRADSECIIEVILRIYGHTTKLDLLELGTGSGALACALARERRHWSILASDISAQALAVAQHNAQSLDLNNITFVHSDWFYSLPTEKKFDVIISNPPYLASGDPHLLHGDLRFEPQSALISGEQGLDALQHIIQGSNEHLNKGGLLALEHGFTQGAAVMTMLGAAGYQRLNCIQDTQGNDRVTLGYYP